MASPMETGTVWIPGRPVEVDLSRVHGDVDSGIRFEFTGEETYLDKLSAGKEIRAAIERGARVFGTELDDILYVEPETDVEK